MNTSEDDHLLIIRPDLPKQTHAIGPVDRIRGALAGSGHPPRAYTITQSPSRNFTIIDPIRTRVVAQTPVAEIEERSSIGPVTVLGTSLAVADEGDLVFTDGLTPQGPGIVRLIGPDYQPTGFASPYVVRHEGLAWLEPGPAFPDGALIAVASRTEAAGSDWVYLINRSTLDVLDSIHAPNGRQAVADPAGEAIFVLGEQLLRYDVLEKRTTHSTSVEPLRGRLTVGQHFIYLTDPGDGRNFPGSGYIYVFTKHLLPLPSIDLRSVSDGNPPVTNYASLHPDGSTLYISAGTASRGPLFGPQPGRVIIVDLASEKSVTVLETGAWGLQEILTF